MAFGSEHRKTVIADFLARAGWAGADRQPLGQDASTRRYERLVLNGQTAMLMDAPRVEEDPCPPRADGATRLAMGWNARTRLAASRVDAFVALSEHLRGLGLSAPEVMAHDSNEGLALIEDFGASREVARVIEQGEANEVDLYRAAAETLAAAHLGGAPEHVSGRGETWPILDFDAMALEANVDLFPEWLPQFDDRMARVDASDPQWIAARDAMIEQTATFPSSFTLRDYHAENLIWLPAREGDARIGLLDFQDAVRGWDAWDMAMLVQDARRPVSQAASDAAITTYLDRTGRERPAFEARLAVVGTLNALRITGLFARLVKRDGKDRYLDFMARQQTLLARNLGHPAAADMAGYVRDVAPFIFEARS
ncbi:MAG: phosphotransferase [Pseudomonadota bacterium]